MFNLQSVNRILVFNCILRNIFCFIKYTEIFNVDFNIYGRYIKKLRPWFSNNFIFATQYRRP